MEKPRTSSMSFGLLTDKNQRFFISQKFKYIDTKGGKMLREKRGMSEVITSVLIILLVIAAIVIVWGFVGPMLKKTSEDIGTGCVTVSTEITTASCADNMLKLTVKRNAGEADLKKIRVVITHDAGSDTFDKEVTMDELASRNLEVDVSGLTGVSKVEIAPIVAKSGGDDDVCSIQDSQEVTCA